jgi:hypothetical protein
MADDHGTERAAQEYLAAKLSQEHQQAEDQLNQQAAAALALTVWKRVSNAVYAKCRDWNAITNEETLTCKETALGDLRIRCAGRNHYIIVHFDSSRRLMTIRNTARPENEQDTVLSIEGYRTQTGRDAHLVRNGQPVDMEMLVLNHLRVLAGLSRSAEG